MEIYNIDYHLMSSVQATHASPAAMRSRRASACRSRPRGATAGAVSSIWRLARSVRQNSFPFPLPSHPLSSPLFASAEFTPLLCCLLGSRELFYRSLFHSVYMISCSVRSLTWIVNSELNWTETELNGLMMTQCIVWCDRVGVREHRLRSSSFVSCLLRAYLLR